VLPRTGLWPPLGGVLGVLRQVGRVATA
jgi:hypothetical protein